MIVIFSVVVEMHIGVFFLVTKSNRGRLIVCFATHVYVVLSILFLTSLSGVLVCGVSLVTEMCRVNPETLSHFRRVSEC